MNPWEILNDVKVIGMNSLSATALAEEGSRWFTGHFPGEPILPGIAILQVVYSAIREDARLRGEPVMLNSLKRVRFIRPVLPGQKFDVSLNRELTNDEIIYTFKVHMSDNMVCSGIVTVVNAAGR